MSGDLLGFHGDSMGFNGDSMGFTGDLLGLNGQFRWVFSGGFEGDLEIWEDFSACFFRKIWNSHEKKGFQDDTTMKHWGFHMSSLFFRPNLGLYIWVILIYINIY